MAGSQLKDIEKFWPSVSRTLSVPHSRKDYERLTRLLDELTDVVKSDSGHPLASLMEIAGVLVADYEEKHFRMKNSTPVSVLKFFMEQHGLKQSDLREIGSQGVVSEILSGRRELNLRQIKVLAKKFSVSPSVFI